jgi:thioredoxin reductase
LSESSEMRDVTVVGGGPVGLYAAFYAGLRGLSTRIVDSLPELGGQLTALYPEKYVYDVAGFAEILAKDLAKGLVDQALGYEPDVELEQKVTELRREDDHWILGTERGSSFPTRTVILCVGVGAFMPRKLAIPDVEQLEGRGLHYLVREKETFRGKRLLIVGGGDSAIDWCMGLEGIAESILLAHRRDVFRAHTANVEAVRASSVEMRTFWELKAIHGEEHVEGATIFDNRSKEEETLELDAILVNIGFLANLGPIKTWGLEIERNSLFVNEHMETNFPGVYAAGDIVTHPGKLKLISTGHGEAAIAANFAATHVDPKAKPFPGHSSNLEGPGK